MAISLVDRTRARLRRYAGGYPTISDTAGLSYSWVTKFAQGKVRNPTVGNLEPLIAVLDAMDVAVDRAASGAVASGPRERVP